MANKLNMFRRLRGKFNASKHNLHIVNCELRRLHRELDEVTKHAVQLDERLKAFASLRISTDPMTTHKTLCITVDQRVFIKSEPSAVMLELTKRLLLEMRQQYGK